MKLWDFQKNSLVPIEKIFECVSLLRSDNPYFFRVVLEKIKLYCENKNIKLNFVFADEVTSQWVDDKLNTLDFFSEQASYIIYDANKLKLDVIQKLTSQSIDFSGRFFILNIEGKLTKDLQSLRELKIDPFNFWEKPQLIDSFIDFFELKIDYELRNFFIENFSDEIESIFIALSILVPLGGQLNLNKVKKVFVVDKYNKFNLASLINQKKFSNFFEYIINMKFDFDRLRDLFNFLQGHFLKFYQVDQINQKSKISKYENEIVLASQNWKESELDHMIKKFISWEILAKSKSPMLKHELQLTFLKSIGA